MGDEFAVDLLEKNKRVANLMDLSQWRLTPYQVLALGFAGLVLLGALLLTLPVASQSGQGTSFIDALFTACSAVCVTGLVTIVPATQFTLAGKVILLRGDMDALPLQEESGEEFASEVPGKMHGCGHDMHTAMMLGTAKLLKEHEDEIEGTVKLEFQPAEEIFQGSLDMLKNGLLEAPKVDAAVMFHVLAGMPLPAGMVLVPGGGITMASCEQYHIVVHGKGGHGSMPNACIDPITAAAHIHIALQEINSRELDPAGFGVFTTGRFEAGKASNVIPDTADMWGTIRTVDPETMQDVDKGQEGELWVRGPQVFQGYWKRPDATAEVLDENGYFKTGDAGVIGANGQLRIIDRAKDVGKMASGAMFAPNYIENKLKFFSHIKEAVCFGNGKDKVCAFVNIDYEAVGNWAERQGIPYGGYVDLASKPQVLALIADCIRQVNAGLAAEEGMADTQVARFLVLHKELDPDDDELTRTRKVRRNFIAEKYAVLIEALYSGKTEQFIETQVKFEDGRTGSVSATLQILEGQVFAATRQAA